MRAPSARLCLFFLLLPVVAAAEPALWLRAVATTCQPHGIPAIVAQAVLLQESAGYPYALNIAGKPYFPATYDVAIALASGAADTHVSFDVGLMQINSANIFRRGWSLAAVLEPQANLDAGCLILAESWQRGGPLWLRIGRYHSWQTRWRQLDYARKVLQHMHRLAPPQ